MNHELLIGVITAILGLIAKTITDSVKARGHGREITYQREVIHKMKKDVEMHGNKITALETRSEYVGRDITSIKELIQEMSSKLDRVISERGITLEDLRSHCAMMHQLIRGDK